MSFDCVPVIAILILLPIQILHKNVKYSRYKYVVTQCEWKLIHSIIAEMSNRTVLEVIHIMLSETQHKEKDIDVC